MESQLVSIFYPSRIVFVYICLNLANDTVVLMSFTHRVTPFTSCVSIAAFYNIKGILQEFQSTFTLFFPTLAQIVKYSICCQCCQSQVNLCLLSGKFMFAPQTDLQADLKPLHLILKQMILHLTATFLQSHILISALIYCLPCRVFTIKLLRKKMSTHIETKATKHVQSRFVSCFLTGT